ncbi:MAG: hypothetical protein ABIY50_07905 [Ignavibacteria bacterium]
MKKKIIIIGSLVLILVFGFLYTQNNNLIADDKDGKKDCSSSCTKKTGTGSSTENKSGCGSDKMSDANTEVISENPVYEFVTDKIDCDGCKPGMSEKLMGISGVKDVSFGETCNVSKMTTVKVHYSATDTTPEIVAASIKEIGLTAAKSCGDGSKCNGKNKTEKKL